jgi:hypothetical protein
VTNLKKEKNKLLIWGSKPRQAKVGENGMGIRGSIEEGTKN